MEKYSKKIQPKISAELLELRRSYKEKGIPTVLEETLNHLLLCLSVKDAKTILEIGTATGVSGIAMLSLLPEARLVTIEKDETCFLTAKENFERFGVSARVRQHLGDATDCLNYLSGSFDFVFLDGAKSHYIDYLFDIKRLLCKKGVLFADNVLFRGYVDGGVSYGRGDYTIVNNMRKFLDSVLSDGDFISTVTEVGDGILIAQKL
ncbi:MAG: O-methyltransferase [Clostridia bacterium]|nr:O-methyltransferase [Clostridia bacterium]